MNYFPVFVREAGPGSSGAVRPTWQVQGEADEGFVAVRGAIAGVGQETHPVSLGSVGGPHLPPVDHVLIPVLHRLGGDTWVEEAELKAGTLLRFSQTPWLISIKKINK